MMALRKGFIVAIDGPAGSGKSTVTHLLAKKLGFVHIDTGALYRAVALKALRNGVKIEDGPGLGLVAANAKLEFHWVSGQNHIFLDGEDVASLIRTPEISMAASRSSAFAQVRAALLELQRKLGRQGNGAVLEGRDIGTIVFPDADVKFYLTASTDTRAQRRLAELESKGEYLSFDEVRKQVIERDRGDTDRKEAPLKKATDAIEIDTSVMTVDQVVQTMSEIIQNRMKN